MEKITLLILYDDDDQEYSLALGKAISNLHHEFDVTVNKRGSFENRNFDLVLVCDQDQANEKDNFHQELIEGENLQDVLHHVIFLVEYQVESTVTGQVPNELYKYSRVQDLVSELRFAYAIMTGKKKIINTKINENWIGFFSASGGAGKTAISIGVAQELARYHDKKVLYLSLEELDSAGYYLKGSNTNRNIGDFLYYLFNKDHENLCTFLESFIFKNEYGVEAFSPSKGRNDLCQLTREELTYFFKVIGDCNRYEYIILDLPSNLSDETLELLGSCTKVVFIEKDEFISKEKSNDFFHFLSATNSSNLKIEFIRVRNLVDLELEMNKDAAMEKKESENNMLSIETDYDSFPMRDNIKEISMENIFGLGIKEVVVQLLK